MNQNEKQYKTFLTYLFFLLITTGFAQAPASSQTDFGTDFLEIKFWKVLPIDGKDVEEIKEWRNYGDNNVVLGNHYTFRPGGELTSAFVTDGYEDKQFYFTYTTKERFHWIYQYEKYDSTTFIFAYKKGRDIVERHFGDFRHKTFYYKEKNGRVIEKKEFFKDVSKKEKYSLVSRTVYNYNQKDSLFGEMHYNYSLNEKPKKVIHKYDPSSGLKTSKTWYNQDGLPHESEHYHYNEANQLIKVRRSSEVVKNYVLFETFYTYQKDRLIKKETVFYLSGQSDIVNFTETKVYRDGRLVYKKVSTAGGPVVESNYQYILQHETK